MDLWLFTQAREVGFGAWNKSGRSLQAAQSQLACPLHPHLHAKPPGRNERNVIQITSNEQLVLYADVFPQQEKKKPEFFSVWMNLQPKETPTQ